MPFVLIYTSDDLNDASFLDPANWKIYVVADGGVLVEIDHHPAQPTENSSENDDEDIYKDMPELESSPVSDNYVEESKEIRLKSKL